MARFRRTFVFHAMTLEQKFSVPAATRVVFTAADGKVGVLAGRSPLIAKIGIGPLVVSDKDGKQQEFFVAGGFARVYEEATTVLADQFEAMEQIDPKEAMDEIERIKAIPARSAEEINAKTSRLAVAQARFNLVQKYRRRMAAKQPDTQPE